MMLPTHSVSSADFHQPLQLMADCHRRIENYLGQLTQVAEHAYQTLPTAPAESNGVLSSETTPALREEERDALAAALRYFRYADPLHTADEEESLLPSLRALCEAAGNGNAETLDRLRTALACFEALREEHEKAHGRHATADEIGQHWLARGYLEKGELKRLVDELHVLGHFYRTHIKIEENQVFPLAAQLLGRENIEKLGREMAARRGLDFELPESWNRSHSGGQDRRPTRASR